MAGVIRESIVDGPGLRFVVFAQGCPHGCPGCHNPATHDFNGGKDCALEKILAAIDENPLLDGVTFSGGECTMQPDFLMALVDACQDEALHVCIDTCGQTDPVFFQALLRKADLFLFDIKQMDSKAHKRLTGVGNGLILRNLRTALAACPEKIRIRIPLMPGLNDGEENIAAVAALLGEYGVRHVDVLPCHSFGSGKYRALSRPVPDVREFSPAGLHVALERFAARGLETEIV